MTKQKDLKCFLMILDTFYVGLHVQFNYVSVTDNGLYAQLHYTS